MIFEREEGPIEEERRSLEIIVLTGVEETQDIFSGIEAFVGGFGNDLFLSDAEGDIIRVENTTLNVRSIDLASGDTSILTIQSGGQTSTITLDGLFYEIEISLVADGADTEIRFTGRTPLENPVFTRATSGDDFLRGSDFTDGLRGRAGDDLIFGFAGTDDLRGGQGDDTIFAGGDGADLLEGGAGVDILRGGRGADIFVYTDGNDLITDFGKKDKIDLSALTAFASFADVEAQATDGQFGVEIFSPDTGGTLLIMGTAAGDLAPASFIF